MKLSDKKIFKSLLIFFDASLFTNFRIKYSENIDKIRLKKTDKKEVYVSFSKDAFIINYIQSITSVLDSKQTFSNEMKLLKFEELMLYILEQSPEKLLSFDIDKNQQEIELRKAVETNIANNIKVEELAFLCNMSTSTFKRRFAEIYDMSPQKWMLLKRMEMARELLTVYHEKPGAVFYKVGYENHSSFSQSFKKIYGITPTEYAFQLVND